MATGFNFSRAGLVANDQLRVLRTIDEQFARNITHALGAWLRTTVTVTPQPASQMIFSQFMEEYSSGCFVTPLEMEPMQGRAALSLGLTVAPPVIDLLLGGSGRTMSLDRDLTEIEEAVLGSVLEVVLREWTAAWTQLGVEFTSGDIRDRESQIRRLMPLQEKVLCARFTMTLADTVGDLLICLPSAVVTSTMKAVSHRRERQRLRSQEERERMEKRVGAATVRTVLHLPPMQLFASDLRSMQPGTVLGLPLRRDVEAELRVGGIPVFRAQPVRSGDHRGARLTHAVENNIFEGDLI